jgi:membrane fusion protein, multidrug efflux system
MFQGRISRLIGIVVGLALVGGTVFTVVTYKRNIVPPTLEPVVRPVKTAVVGEPVSSSLRKYPGRVRALQRADIAFEVEGQVLDRYVNKGDVVKAGAKIARVDPRDYENQLAAANANLNKAQVYLERVKTALDLNAATVQELTDADADVKVAEAAVAIRAKAVADTIIYASFDGVIADTYVEQYENVQAKQAIVSLQDNSQVLIDASIPEWRFAEGRSREGQKVVFDARFDYLPGEAYSVEVKEFTTEADPITQTYEVTFLMDVPEDTSILPGMTATVHESIVEEDGTGDGFTVPLAAVPVDTQGQYYTWRLAPSDQAGQYAVARVDVTVGEMRDQDVIVLTGLDKGDRIVTAGVHSLEAGQVVTLWDAKKGVVTE